MTCCDVGWACICASVNFRPGTRRSSSSCAETEPAMQREDANNHGGHWPCDTNLHDFRPGKTTVAPYAPAGFGLQD